MDSAKPGEISHVRYIDAMRGIAFLAVLTVHVGANVEYTGFGLVPNGMYGVQLFFLVSAVTLLRSHALRQERSPRAIAGFYLRRVFRIAPLFWCGIIFYLWLDGRGPRFWAPNGIKNWEVVLTALFIHGWTPPSLSSVVPGGWSIAIEMIFYFWLPVLWNRIRTAAVAVLCCIAALLFNFAITIPVEHWFKHAAFRKEAENLQNEFFHLWFPAQLPVFLLGFVLYFILEDEAIMTRLRSRFAPLALLSAGAYLFFCLTRLSAPPQLPFSSMYAIAWCLIVLSQAARPTRWLVNPVTVWIGTLSFSCYLTHFATIRLGIWLALDRRLAPTAPGAKFCLLWTTTLLLTIAVSSITYWLIERPGVRIGNRLIKRFVDSRPITRSGPMDLLGGQSEAAMLSGNQIG